MLLFLDRVGFVLVMSFVGFLVVRCSVGGEPGETAPEQVEKDEVLLLQETLLADHVVGPFVVSREKDGAAVHLGEGILHGGVGSFVLTCEQNDAMDLALVDLILRHNGALVRYEPLGEYAGGREITWDGAVGFYLAVADSVVRCGRADRWRDTFALHLKYLDEHHQAYNEATDAAAAPGYDTVHHLIAAHLGLRKAPHPDALTALDGAVVATLASLAVRPTEPCFLANLGFLSLLTARTLGREPAALSRNLMCHWSRDLDMPTWDHFCGRRNIDEWAHQDWKRNEWENRLQRCGSRESPDGHSEEERRSPSLDRLLAHRLAHGS